MVDVTRIKKITGKVKHWPSSKPQHYTVDMIGPKNETYESTIHESEFQIWAWYTANKGTISERQMRDLLTRIGDYGQHKYEDGSFEAGESGDI